jgi:hypothetical protein
MYLTRTVMEKVYVVSLGGYLNRNGCYDENVGEPDVIKALFEIEMGSMN